MTDFGDIPALRDGLDAWRRWDLDGIERSMHPAVTLRAIQPGPWDCENREQVMTLLRQRAEQRHGKQPGEVDIRRLDEATFLVSGLGDAKGTATLVTVSDGLVVAMQQVATDAPNQHAADSAAAVRSGDIDALVAALDAQPRLATDPVPGFQGRTLLHIVTDWPGYWPKRTGGGSVGDRALGVTRIMVAATTTRVKRPCTGRPVATMPMSRLH